MPQEPTFNHQIAVAFSVEGPWPTMEEIPQYVLRDGLAKRLAGIIADDEQEAFQGEDVYEVPVKTVPDMPKRRPYAAVNCHCGCGLVALDDQSYREQIMRANDTWRCSQCGGDADWNDDVSRVTNPDDLDELAWLLDGLVDGLLNREEILWNLFQALTQISKERTLLRGLRLKAVKKAIASLYDERDRLRIAQEIIRTFDEVYQKS